MKRLLLFGFLTSLLLWPAWMFAGKNVTLSEDELLQTTEHIDKLLQRDSLNNLIIEELRNEVKRLSPPIADLPKLPTPPEVNSGDTWGYLFQAMLFGLIALLMPCVYPMVPMTVNLFSQGNPSKTQALQKALIYGLSIVVIYTSLAIIPALIFGANAANDFSTHWALNLGIFAVFFVFGLSFLGLFEIVLPHWLVNKVDRQADKGGYMGMFFMAFTLVLVSFSCTVPFVGKVLVEVEQGNLWKPVFGMLAYSITFALPFFLFALFPSWLKTLPRSGSWMSTLKVVLGFLEIALAIHYLSKADLVQSWGLLDRDVFLTLWIALGILLSLYLLGKLKLKNDSSPAEIGAIRLLFAGGIIAFTLYMIPGLFGAPLKGISAWIPPSDRHDFDLTALIEAGNNKAESSATGSGKVKYAEHFKIPYGIKGYFEYKQALDSAKKLKKPLFIDFTGKACANCRLMENKIWSQDQVLSILKNDVVVVALYCDYFKEMLPEDWAQDKEGKQLKAFGDVNKNIQRRFGVVSQPYYVMLDPYTEKNLVPSIAYESNVEIYLAFLQSGLSEFKKLHP